VSVIEQSALALAREFFHYAKKGTREFFRCAKKVAAPRVPFGQRLRRINSLRSVRFAHILRAMHDRYMTYVYDPQCMTQCTRTIVTHALRHTLRIVYVCHVSIMHGPQNVSEASLFDEVAARRALVAQPLFSRSEKTLLLVKKLKKYE
jgi:hypothetical protein